MGKVVGGRELARRVSGVVEEDKGRVEQVACEVSKMSRNYDGDGCGWTGSQ